MNNIHQLSHRYVIFEADGTLRRISIRDLERLISGTHALPEFAGQKIRFVELTYEASKRLPVRVHRVIAAYWVVDPEGRIDDGLRESGVRRLEADGEGRALSDDTWVPTKEQMTLVTAMLTPEGLPPSKKSPRFLRPTLA